MNIKEAVDGLKQDIYNLKDFLTDTEKQTWQEALETVLSELEKKDTEITSLQMEHEHDLKMIDEVKGETVKLYGEIEGLKKDNSHQWEERCKLTFELEKKDTIINTMQAEFERLEDLEDNTDILKMELEKKDKIIDFIAKWLYEDDTSFGYGKLKEVNTQEKIKEYFKKKVEE